jgi:L-ascorbate metabolism protein UlaG (beta-lactamase superfamily)
MLIRNIQLIIHTITATSSSATPAADRTVLVSVAVETLPRPTTIRITPATAIPSGSHSRVAASNARRNLPPSSVMLGPARYLADFARFVASKGPQERHDAQALRELEQRRLELPDGLELEWLGVSGYRMTFEGQALIIDPYLSRVSLRDVIARRAAIPDPALVDRYLGGSGSGNVVGVLVGHTHFDHAVDAPAVARRFGCQAYGSASLMRLMRLHGLADRAVEVVPRRVYELGPFKVSFHPSMHSKLVLGLAVPFDGELTCEHLDALSPGAYRCGQVWGIHLEVAGASFYHQGSANLIDDLVPRGGVDFFLAGIAGRGFTADYWPRILRRLEPRTIVPTHYDDFFRPLDAPDPGFTTNVNLARVPDEVRKVSSEFEVAALPLLRGTDDRA